jgi:predicted PurR-regulated permease PerM
VSFPNPNSLPVWTPRQVFGGTLIVVAVSLGFWLLFEFNLVVICLVLAIVYSMAIEPLVQWLQRRGVSRAIGVGLVYMGLLAGAVGIVLILVPLLVEQGSRLAVALTAVYDDLRDLLAHSPSRLIRQSAWQLLPRVSLLTPTRVDGGSSLDLVAQLASFGSLLVKGLLVSVAVLLLAYYWTLDQERAIRSIMLLSPPYRRERLRELLGTIRTKVGEYVRGVAILCLIVGSLSFAAYTIIGLPDALVLGILAGLFEAVPLVGPAIGALPAALIALTFDPPRVWSVIAAALTIQVLENTILVPRVMRRAVGVNPFVSLLALAAFGSLFGIAGALLAIPMAAVLQIVVGRLLIEPQAGGPTPEGRDSVSVLQVETRALIQDMRRHVLRSEPGLEDRAKDIEEGLEAIAADLDAVLARANSKEPAS